MAKQFVLHKLSTQFFLDFPKKLYPEIEEKENRPYIILVCTINGIKFGLPLRTNIKHNYCYKFKRTTRNTKSSTGIDFSKAVVLNNSNHIGNTTTIDSKEYIELDKNIVFIISKFKQYVNSYIDYKKSNQYDKNKDFKYKYSTLQYFHNELGL